MKYVLDNNISPRFAAMLRALDVDTIALREILPANTDDNVFLSHLSDRTLITGDQHIRTRKIEATALKQSGVSAIFFAPFWPKLKFWGQAQWLVTKWPDIDRFVSSTSMGTYAVVQQGGAIRLIDVKA